ncbi:unnamed protein product [Mytilus edulis]|uniref:DDE Tnp4 domain-containing protein n=1 Tax=Mytilus edulis TaxID=6550 RepID=A0A8S3PQV4_MYTED|nr:unnamed protein product [Mytilus edulis]
MLCQTFTPPRKTRNNNDSAACLNLGNILLERKRICTYAGTLINSDGKTFDRSDKSSKKLKQKLHSLYTVGVNPPGMSALTNNLIWKRVILTTALYLSSSSAETSGDSDDESLLLKTATSMIERRTIPKNGSFVDIVLSYDYQEFRRNFRLSTGTFHRIVGHLAGKVDRREYKGGRPQLTLEKQILIALWYYANTECYMSTAGRFVVSDINRKGLHSIVAQVVCDHEMNCISVNTGWPGSVHDAM